MTLGITGEAMTLEIDSSVGATARFSEHAAADSNCACVFSALPARCSAATR